MSCGIYKIENLINHKVYIGQSINIEARFVKHKSCKDNCLIHKAIQKYGQNNFSYEIIEECDVQDLNEREIYWIKFYQSCILNNLNKGYNMNYGGSNGEGLKKGQPIEQYSLSGEYIKTYPSARQASLDLNISQSAISNCITGKSRWAGGYQWKKVGSDKEIMPIQTSNIIFYSKVIKYDLDGNFLNIYDNLSDAAKQNNGHKSGISKACKKNTTYLGFLWKYQDDDKEIQKVKKKPKIGQYDLNNNLLNVFETISQAGRITNTSISNISEVCKGKRKTANNFIWKYIN